MIIFRRGIILLLIFSLFWHLDENGLLAQPRKPRHRDFSVPAGLRPRVNFWIGVFAKYGSREFVIHHRNFPQAIFEVVDLSAEGVNLNPVQFQALKKKVEARKVKEVYAALKRLSSTAIPENSYDRGIYNAMKMVPGSSAKYQAAIKNDLVRTQTGIRERYQEALERSGRYIKIMEEIFAGEFGLPVELTRLPFIESSFDYKAYSSVGAAGIWQFMPATARLYMKVNRLIDERRDVIESTKAAAKYLLSAKKQLGTWPLALTSYNHGIAGVRNKVTKLGTRDIVRVIEHPTNQVFGFASNNFFPEFLAALEIYDNPQKFFPGLRLEPSLSLAEYPLPYPLSVRHVTSELGVDKDELMRLNYAIGGGVWSGRYSIPQGYRLKVPRRVAHKIVALKTKEPGAAPASAVYGGLVYKVRRGDTLLDIARKFDTTVASLKSINGLKSDRLLIGQSLKTSSKERGPAQSKSAAVRQAGAPPRSTAPQYAKYKVVKGDTVSGIASRFRMGVSQLKALNGLKGNVIRIGQVLKVSGVSGRGGNSMVKGSASSRKSVTTYRVKRGDTLWKISQKFQADMEEIKRANSLKSGLVKIGQVLKIP